jgi:spore maturation protein CgeB
MEEKEVYSKGDNFPFNGNIKHIKVNSKYEGWSRIRKEVKERYICLNYDDKIPLPFDNMLGDLNASKTKMIVIGIKCRYKWALQYKEWYYGYDFNIMMSVLKRYYPAYYKFANNEILNTNVYYLFAGIFVKSEYDKIWDWMQGVFVKCEKDIPIRRSVEQNKWKDHMAPFLFTIYIKYWQMRTNPLISLPFELDREGDDAVSLPDKSAPRDELVNFLSEMVSEGKIETASGFSLNELSKRADMQDVCGVFREYERQRQFEALTSLDKSEGFEDLLGMESGMKKAPSVRDQKPQMLIFKWNSFGHNNLLKAFESFGFECTCISMPELKYYGLDGEFQERLINTMNEKTYDVVYSTNYHELIAQVCYMYNVPYLAWYYDTVVYSDENKYITSPTTNIFLFDSNCWKNFKEAGVERAHYLPLGVNLDVYDNIKCSDKDRERYNAEISFVGQLYDSNVTKAMGYLNDYQKAFLGALIDNQIGIHGYDFFSEIIMNETVGWLDNPKFNRIVNAEVCEINKDIVTNIDKKVKVNPNALKFILNKQTTNKERLLLVTLLSKHHEVKLYSNMENELFKDLTFCGTVDYYTEMPKVFKCSKINLNSTFRNIKNGIPLRCIDVMGCGGCLLTNYQKDFDDHFKDGENVLLYSEPGEALEKADFYLAHDTLREKVALSGYETVRKYYSYPVKIKEMLELAELGHLVKACGK